MNANLENSENQKSMHVQLSPQQVVLAYGAALQQQNLEEILALYHADAEIIPDQLPSLKGTKNITAFYQNTFRNLKIEGGFKDYFY